MRSCWGDCFFDFSGDFAGLFLREGLKISFVNFQNRKPDESLFHGRLSVGLDFDRTHRRFRFAFGYVEHCRKRDQMLLLFPGRYLRLEEKDLSFARHAEPAWPISAIGTLQGRPGGGARFRGSSLRVSRHRQQGQNENGDQNSRDQNSHGYFSPFRAQFYSGRRCPIPVSFDRLGVDRDWGYFDLSITLSRISW